MKTRMNKPKFFGCLTNHSDAVTLLRSKSGMTLISVLVAASVGLIVMGTMMAMQMQQIRQNLILEKKLDIMGVKSALTEMLAESNTCKCMFVSGQNNPISLVNGFTSGAKSVSIKNGCSNTTWLAANAIIPGSSTNLKIEDAKLKNVSSIGTNVYQADLEISFQDTGLKMKPIISHQVFKTTGDNITDCVSGAADLANLCTGIGGTYNATTGNCDTVQNMCAQIGGTYDASNPNQKCRNVASAAMDCEPRELRCPADGFIFLAPRTRHGEIFQLSLENGRRTVKAQCISGVFTEFVCPYMFDFLQR